MNAAHRGMSRADSGQDIVRQQRDQGGDDQHEVDRSVAGRGTAGLTRQATNRDEQRLGCLGYAEVPASASTVVTRRMPLFAATWLSTMYSNP